MNENIITSDGGMMKAVMMAQAMKAEDLQEQMARQFWPMMGTANLTAYFAIDDAVEQMKAAGMWRQREKQEAQRAVEAYQRYDRLAYEHFRDMGDDRYPLWQDVIGRAAEKLQPDVMKLRFAVKNVIDRAGVGHSGVYAHIQTALALVTLSTLMFDTMMEGFQRQTVIPIDRMFAAGRLTVVERHWKMVGEITGKKVLRDVDLRDDPQCMLGVEVILTRYQSASFLNEAAGEALALNPNIVIPND